MYKTVLINVDKKYMNAVGCREQRKRILSQQRNCNFVLRFIICLYHFFVVI